MVDPMTRHTTGDRTRSKKLTYLVTGGLTVAVIAAPGAYAFAGEHESTKESGNVKVSNEQSKDSEGHSDDSSGSPTGSHKVKVGKTPSSGHRSGKPGTSTPVARPTSTPSTAQPTTAKPPTAKPPTAKPTTTTKPATSAS